MVALPPLPYTRSMPPLTPRSVALRRPDLLLLGAVSSGGLFPGATK